jgi:hypothetical protein
MTKKRFQSRTLKANKEDGFTMITALMVIFLIVSIVATVVAVTSSDLESSLRQRFIIQTRFTAESVTDAIFATIAQEKNDYLNKATRRFAKDPSQITPTTANNPLYGGVTPGAYNPGWFAIKDDGTIIDCPSGNRNVVCFTGSIESSTVGPTAREAIAVNIITRGFCKTDSPPENCIYRQFQQQYRTRAYVDDVGINNSELPSPVIYGGTYPAVIRNVAFLNGDILKGNFATNSDGQALNRNFTFCAFNFSTHADAEFHSKDGAATSTITGNTSCDITSPASGFHTIDLSGQFLPGQVDVSGAKTATDVAGDNSVFASLAGPLYTYVGDADITLNSDTIDIGPNHYGYPDNGVFYIRGNAKIHGQYSHGLTIYVTGDVLIDGDIQLLDKSGMTSVLRNYDDPIFDDADYINTTELGIVTSKDIRVICNPADDKNARCQDIQVTAVLNASAGTIYNDAWSSSPVSPEPTFKFRGSMIANFHPVFGSYTSISGGALVHGFKKDLRFDARLGKYQPPFFFRTTQANVVRTALDESPCDQPSRCV